jgi:hypothetical protein
MAIELSGYKFAGTYASTSSLEDRSGVYAILTPTTQNRYRVLDIGESATVKSRVENHDRESCWRRQAKNGEIRYAVHYTPGLQQTGRRAIEQEIRGQYHPPCGTQ